MVERGPQCRRRFADDAIGLGHRRHQGRQGNIHRQTRYTERGQPRGGDHNRLDIGGGPRGPDQLGADLADLALGPDLRSFDPQHLAGIASRSGRGALPSRVAAMRAICGVMSARTPIIRCEPGSIVRKVALAIAAPAPASSALLEFDKRRLDPLIAMGG